MTRSALLLTGLLALSGCGSAGLAFGGANLATLIGGDKTIPDYAVSRVAKQDCSLLHAARNEPYCQGPSRDPRAELAALSATMYCYRTLGGVTCYDRPDYAASSQTRVNFAYGLAPRLAAPPAAGPADAPPVAALPGAGTY
ncbi:MAG: hypothetical protein ACE5GS_14940 [Kiloniellaceae bacterium]